MHCIKFMSIAIAALCLAGVAAAADAEPTFGPQTFERTEGEADVYNESFETQGGEYVLFLRNGDGEESRVASASVEINGQVVVRPSDLAEGQPGLHVGVELPSGENELVVELTGQPGSFVTLAIVPRGARITFVHGRLLLPWSRNDEGRTLVLAFKNGSSYAPRVFRVVFFRPNGEVAGVSQRIPLPPKGSLALPAELLLGDAEWTSGSIEVFYAGPGVARLFGTARHINFPLGDSDVQSLEQAGLRIFRGPGRQQD